MPHDPLAQVIGAFSASLSGQRVGRVLLRSRRRIAEYCQVSEMAVNRWRKAEWWPGSRRGTMEVWSDELDKALRDAGLQGIQARQSGLSSKPNEAKRELESVVDLEKFELGEPEDDLTSARAATRQLQAVVRAWKMDSLANPATARLFAQFTEALSRQTQRMTALQQSMMDLQLRRGELLTAEEACSVYDEFIANVVGRLADLGQAFGDLVKDLEIHTYGESKIDSETLADQIDSALANFRDSVADALESVKTDLEPDIEEEDACH